MQIKKMEVQGFKSFADKTTVEFPVGVTAIVGPNGSGKSNISDAVRWVLGEQSTKNLRSGKMEDVIFAGTENRRKVGFAEVSLYIDNSDGVLPVDYSEVVITRRLFRSGESSYLINGSECRLKDVQELFLDTGVGKDGYSLIGQGKIDEIISSKSEERRAIFEEASGIMKYKTRKEEALKKLANADINLERVNDILKEVETNLLPLEEKSKKARKYLEIKDKLKVLDVNIFLNDVKQNAEKLGEINSQISTLNADIEKEEKDALEMEKAKLNLKERLTAVSNQIEENQSKYYELDSLLQKFNSKKELLKSNIDNSNNQIERLENEIVSDNEKIKVLEEEILNREKKKENLLNNKKKFEDELNEKQTKLSTIMETLDKKGEYIQNLKKEIEQLEEKNDEINIEDSSFDATIDALNRQIEDLSKSSNGDSSEKDRITMDKESAVEKINEINKKIIDINEKINEEENKQNAINTEKEKIELELDDIKKEYMTLSSSLSYLKHLEEENEGYVKSVKSIIEHAKENNLTTIHGTVASVISTEEKYERAIEIALGGYIQNIIVDTENDAKNMIEYLKKNSYGRATFLPLSSMKKVVKENYKELSKFDGFIGMAADLVKTDSRYENIVNIALNKCAIIDNLDSANYIHSKLKENIKLVTLEGDLIQPLGSITGGQTSNKTSGVIGREEKIKKITTSLKEMESKSKEITEKYDAIVKEFDDYALMKATLVSEKEKLNVNLAVFKEKLENLNKEEEKILDRRNRLKENTENLKNQIDELNNKIIENNKKLEENNLNIEKRQKEVEEYARFNKENQKELDILNEDITNLKISLASFDESSASIDEMKEKLIEDIDNFKDGKEKKATQKREFMLSIIEYNKEIEDIEKQAEESKKFKEEYISISDNLKVTKNDISEKLDTLEVKMLEGVNRTVKIKDEVAKLDNKKVKYDLELDNLKNRMWDEYELTVNSSKEFAASSEVVEDISKAKKEAEEYRKEIKELGDVDVTSIDAYTETKARHNFITAQKKDLDETKKKLENLIDNITTIMKDQFSTQFKEINSNFKDTFGKLFGGGKAALKLTDESNILESGIEIEVQPPGKKLQNMSLLSGGEKALTAIALLFAILKIKAPPFCILDEIEAALDDVNVSRFADYIKMYSDNTQFIVITHRKGTMEAAKTVYGVTMEEYGVSKLVSMKLK